MNLSNGSMLPFPKHHFYVKGCRTFQTSTPENAVDQTEGKACSTPNRFGQQSKYNVAHAVPICFCSGPLLQLPSVG